MLLGVAGLLLEVVTGLFLWFLLIGVMIVREAVIAIPGLIVLLQ